MAATSQYFEEHFIEKITLYVQEINQFWKKNLGIDI